MKFQMFKLDSEKAEEPEIKLPTSIGSLNKQKSSRKTSAHWLHQSPWLHSFPKLEPVCCSMSCSRCCFLTYIQISQEAGQVVWYSHLFKNFPQFVVIHTVRGFGIVNKAEVDVFLELSRAFSMIQWMLAIWFLVPLPFLNPAWTVESFRFTHFWSPTWRILNITLACEMSAIVQ